MSVANSNDVRCVGVQNQFTPTYELTGTPLRVQFNAGANPFAEPENKRKAGEGIVSMRRRKTAQRAELKAKKDDENKKR